MGLYHRLGKDIKGHTHTNTYLDDAEGFVWVVPVQVVDVPRQGDADEVLLLPQASQLLVHDIIAHVEGGDGRARADVP